MGVKKDLVQPVDVPATRQVVIENPIINSPFDEPSRHFRFSDEGITNEEVDGRRTSSYFVPIAKAKKKGANQLQFDTGWTQRKEPKMLVGGPGPKQAKRRRNASSLYAQVAPKFSSVVFAASPLTATKEQIEIGNGGTEEFLVPNPFGLPSP
jgi:hypothetical protein